MKNEIMKCNMKLLKDKMREKAISVEDMANYLGVDHSIMYQKFSEAFDKATVKEIKKVTSLIGLNNDEVIDIFGIRCQVPCKKIVANEEYPKRFMSITELVEYTGISRDYFKNIALAKDAPIIRTAGGGKFYFKTSELDNYMIKVTKARM